MQLIPSFLQRCRTMSSGPSELAIPFPFQSQALVFSVKYKHSVEGDNSDFQDLAALTLAPQHEYLWSKSRNENK